jgi:hypothetical protein
MATWAWIVIALAVVIVVGMVVMAARQRRTAALRQRFGPEYDRAVETKEGRRAAEADLHERERQHAQLDIRPLPESTRARFAEEWREVQERFVDQPSGTIAAADGLVRRVMEARGYPTADFEDRAGLVSVDHPEVVENYRSAHSVHERAQAQRASTEELRAALLRYRSLFDELLQPAGGPADSGLVGDGQPDATATGHQRGDIPRQARAEAPDRPLEPLAGPDTEPISRLPGGER